ncbi:tetratricopeptide repeat protein [Capilliphycus salinus ALCB114379]|uniref:tetratricopeptide repeat protein n=1 Tax=Capilliphycus salinus TaxID=2768948 RepID=UPI0039A5CAEE
MIRKSQKEVFSDGKNSYELKPDVNSVQIHYKLARLMVQQGRIDEAIPYYQKILHNHPTHPSACQELGNIFLKLQRAEEAIACYRQALEIESNQPQIYHNLGEAFSQLENWTEAIDAYRQAIKLRPDFCWSYNNLADIFFKLGQWTEAANTYQQAIQLNPDFGLSHHKLGEVYTKLERWEKAIYAYQNAARLNPDFIWSQFNLGQLLNQQNRWQEAIIPLEKAIELEPNFEWSHYYLAEAHSNLQQWEKAIAAYRKAIEIKPNFALACGRLGDALIQQQQWSEAIICYQKATEIDPVLNVSFYRNLELAKARINPTASQLEPLVNKQNQWPYISVQPFVPPKTLPDGRPWPKISVITPSYNQGEFIEETILSVIHQNYPNLEYILIDGGSTDETMTVVNQYRRYLSYVVSEPDKGQSNALNKGFQRATGEIVTWLNSDDRFAPGALYAAALAFYTSDADVVAGVCQIFQQQQEVLHHVTSCPPGTMSLTDILDVENSWLSGKFFHQPEVLFTRAIWEKTGGSVDESLYYSMDYEMWARFAAAGAKIHPITHPIAQFRMHEAQKTSATEKYKPELLATRDRLRTRFLKNQQISSPQSSPPVEPPPKRHQLRVILLSDLGFSGGAGIAHEQIGRALATAGHQVIPIVGASGWKPEPIEFSAEKAMELISCIEPDLVVLGNLHNIQESVELLERICQKYPTIFVMHDQWLLTGRCAYTGNCDRYKTSCDRHCPTFDQYPALTPEKIQPTFEQKRQILVNNENLLVLANSQWTMNWARQALRSSLSGKQPDLLKKRIQKITLGIDLDIFKPRDKQACRKRLGLPEDRFIILTGSTSLKDERKGGKYLIEALKLANLDNILLVGFGYGSPEVEGLNFEILHTGFIQNRNILAYYYSAADLFVGASLEETLGLTFVEAAACGTPAVGYDTGGVKEAICDGVTGRLVEEKTPDALAKMIGELYRDERQLKRLSCSAPISVASHFSIRSTYQSFVVALDRVNWLDKLQIAPISKFAVTPPQLSPSLCVKYLAENHVKDDIIEGISGSVFAGFASLEPPYPDLNLFGSSRWALWPESKFVIETERQQRGHLILAYRSVYPGQILEVWSQDKLIIKTLVEASEIQQENLLTFPVTLEAGLNFFILKTHQFTEDDSQRKLAVLVEKITFTSDLNWRQFGNGNQRGVTEKVISMDGTLQGTGWFPWESANGVPVRWMERVGSVIIDGMDVTQALQVEVRVRSTVAPEFLENLTLKVNGNSLTGELEPREDGSWRLSGRVSPGILTPQAPFVLSLHSPDVKQLSPQDFRRASVLVEGMVLQALETPPETPPEWVIFMDENLLGSGWFSPEKRQGVAVRWMQKVGSLMVEGVDTSQSLQVQIHGISAVEQGLLDTLWVRINGNLVPGAVRHQPDGKWQFEGEVPAGVLPENTPFLLTVEASEVKPLSSEDQRFVSVLIQEIRFR